MKRAHSFETLGILFLASSILAGRVEAAPSLYRHWIESLPTRGGRCADEAQRIRASFKTLSGIGLAEARCAKETESYFDIELRYSAEQRLHAVSTIEFSVGVPSSYQGTFHSRRQCEQALPSATETFRARTGLEPMVAYCYRESDEPRNSFVLRIDSFGKPLAAPVIAKRELFGDPVSTDLDGLERKIRSYTEGKLGKETSVVLSRYVLEHAIRVLYYSEKAKPVRLEELGKYQRSESCLRSQKLAESRFGSMEQAPPFLCVHSSLLGRYTLELFQIKIGDHLDPVAHPRTYGSYAACEQDMETAMKEVSESLGAPAVSGVCFDGSGEVRMTVLLLKSS